MVAALLSLLPFEAWTLRNERTFHVFQPLAPRYANDPGEFAFPGFVRWIRSLAADFTSTSEIYWNGNSDRIDPGNLPARAYDNAGQYQETRRILEQYNATTTLTPELDASFAQLAAERVREHPIRYYLGCLSCAWRTCGCARGWRRSTYNCAGGSTPGIPQRRAWLSSTEH